MGNTVARSHIRDADRGVAKATRANTRRNSTNVPVPAPVAPISSESLPSQSDVAETAFPSLQPEARPVKRRARHPSPPATFLDQPPSPLPDLMDPPPGASPAEVHAARTETPPRLDKPPCARKVVSFNENVHVVTYPYDPANHSAAELPPVTRYPEARHARRRSRSVFRLLSRANEQQCLPHEQCCGLRIASDAQVVYDDQHSAEPRLLSFDSSKDLYENSLVVPYERPYSDAVPDDFDYVHREVDEEDLDDDTFSLSDAHPSCDAIDEPEAIGDQLLSREDSRDCPPFDIAPLWQRLKRVDELDTVAKNTFLRETARRRHTHDSKPPRPPRRDAQGISHSRAARAKARRALEGSPKNAADKSPSQTKTTPTRVLVPLQSEGDSVEKLASPVAKTPSQAAVEDSPKPETVPIKPIMASPTTPESGPTVFSPPGGAASRPEPRTSKEPDPSQERRIPAPARSRATSAGSIQKHMASFTTESAASTDRDLIDESPLGKDKRNRVDRSVSKPKMATGSAVTAEPNSEKNLLGQAKEQDAPLPAGRSRVRSEPHEAVSEAQPLATTIRTSRSARVSATYRCSMDEPLPVNIRARATVRPEKEPALPEIEANDENISHSWARLNDLTRKRESSTGLSSYKKTFPSPLRASLEQLKPIDVPEEGNDKDFVSSDRESDKTSAMGLDLDGLSLPLNDDYGVTPYSPVQGYAPIAGVYYGTSSPSTGDPGSPRVGLGNTGDVADYPEYEMLNGNVGDDGVFDSEPSSPMRASKTNWGDGVDDDGLFGLDDDVDGIVDVPGFKGARYGERDRTSAAGVPEVLLHDWSGNTPVEPNVEMVDSAPNSRSSTSHLFSVDGGNGGMVSKRMNGEIGTLFQNEGSRRKKSGGTSCEQKEKGTSSSRRTRIDRASGLEIDASVKAGQVRRKRGDGKKVSLSNTEAWMQSEYEVKDRARSDAHENRRPFPGSEVRYPPYGKLQDVQLSVDRKSVSEMVYRKGEWEDEKGRKRVEDVGEGTFRGMMGRLVSGMHIAKRLVSNG